MEGKYFVTKIPCIIIVADQPMNIPTKSFQNVKRLLEGSNEREKNKTKTAMFT